MKSINKKGQKIKGFFPIPMLRKCSEAVIFNSCLH